ncbi:hypothetical protein K8S19_08110 [bacterium]|nr:hypothetical protein [bacterium]
MVKRYLGVRYIAVIILCGMATLAQAATIQVTSREDSGAGTLRQAVLDATAGDTITFGPGASGNSNSITVFSAIWINNELIIDGESNDVVIGYYPAQESNTYMFLIAITSDNTQFRNVALVDAYQAIRSVNADNISITGCRIGLDWTDVSRPNRDGLYILGSTNAVIGTPNISDRNIISSNTHYGIYVGHCSSMKIQNNYIGTDSSGLLARPNLVGVEFGDQCENNMIGGSWYANEGNLISGNSNSGLRFTYAATSGNSVCGNVIGLGSDMATPLGHSFAGIGIGNYSNNNWIGLPVDGYGNTIAANDRGIYNTATTSHHYIIQNNQITNNSSYGLDLYGFSFAIGGHLNAAYKERNLISGSQYNIRLQGSGNTVSGNLIGTNWAGDAAAISDQCGVWITGDNNLVGGPNLSAGQMRGNLISGSSGTGNAGVLIYDCQGNTVIGNIIGLNLAGNAAIPNYHGLRLYYANATNNYIGGPDPIYRNIISGNSLNAVFLELAVGNYILGNDIGLSLDRSSVIENFNGFQLRVAIDNVIGGLLPEDRNYIYCLNYGFELYDGADNNTICQNWLNCMPDGTATGLTMGTGVRISNGQGNFFGIQHTGSGNIFTGMNYGISILNSNAIQNGLFANTITAIGHDAILLSAGGNTDKIPPVITAASSTLISGTAGNNDYIEVFLAEAGGNPGGSISLVGRTTADGSGNWSLTPSGLVGGETVSALATDSSNNTSSFATDVVVIGPPTATATPTRTITFTATVTPTITLTGTITLTQTVSPTLTVTPTATVTPDNPLLNVDLGGRPALAFPNPAKSEMRFVLHLEQAAQVEIMLYNLIGERVAVLQENLPEGPGQSLDWDCKDVAPGVYMARVIVQGSVKGTIKVSIVK